MPRKTYRLSVGIFVFFLALMPFLGCGNASENAERAKGALKALIIDGQNNHNWEGTTPVVKEILEQSGLFQVKVATTPPTADGMSEFKPDFAMYDVIVSNYNGTPWPDDTRNAFVDYMRSGGGFVVIHAADNSFPEWREYNEMIGLGGWGGRDEKSGPMVRYRNGEVVMDRSPGRGGTHGKQREYRVVSRNLDHPITRDLPRIWMHAKDELYAQLRGPAKNLDVLATSYSKVTGEHEPVLFTIQYGEGRVFHTVLGHDVYPMRCVGFIVTLQRGTEWAATGEVAQTEIPDDFPTANEISIR